MLSPRIGRSTCQGTGLTETWTVTVVLETMAIFTSGGLGCSTEAKEAAFYIGICPWAFGNLVGHVPCAALRSIRDRRLMEIPAASLLCWKLGCCQLWGLFGGAISSQQSLLPPISIQMALEITAFVGQLADWTNTHFAVINSMNLDNVPFLASHETVSVWSVGCRVPTWLQHVHILYILYHRCGHVFLYGTSQKTRH